MIDNLGKALRQFFGKVVMRPMPWRMIDTLESLDDACERQERAGAEHDNSHPAAESADGAPARRDREDRE